MFLLNKLEFIDKSRKKCILVKIFQTMFQNNKPTLNIKHQMHINIRFDKAENFCQVLAADATFAFAS